MLYLMSHPCGRLDSAAIPEYFAPPGVFALTSERGTDLTRLRGSYRQAVTLFTEELDFLSDIDKTWIMGRGIAEWRGWPL